jgi:hypothetical protein
VIPKTVIQQVDERARGLCEWCGQSGGILGLQHAHLVHRKMGGRGKAARIIDDPRNIALLCGTPCHDILDSRIYKPEARKIMLVYLKRKIGWEGWANEYGVTTK